jgi:transposase-like protein
MLDTQYNWNNIAVAAVTNICFLYFNTVLSALMDNQTDLPQFAYSTGLLSDISNLKCDSCESQICYTGQGYRCTQTYCGKRFGQFYGTPFSGTVEEKRKQLILFACFVEDIKVSKSAHIAGVSEHTTTKWFQIFRDRFKKLHTDEMSNNQLGPQVEVDESLYGHRKYNVGRIVPGQWVFGICESQRGGRAHMQPVPNRSAAVLLPQIAADVQPNSTIDSDFWRSYGGVHEIGFQHRTVNHSQNFIDPATGANTQRMEALWSSEKKWSIQHNYTSHTYLEGYCHEYCHRLNRSHDFETLWRSTF